MAVTHLADVPTAAASIDAPALDTPLPDPVATDSAATDTTRRQSALGPGDKVEVRRRLDNNWARGFEVVEVLPAGYRLRRLSDGVEIPATFADADIRKERKRDFWWH